MLKKLNLNRGRVVPTAVLVLSALALLWAASRAPQDVARGKSLAQPLPDDSSPEQGRAQTLALGDERVQEQIVGRRAEVFGVRRVLAGQFTPASQACAVADCRQVEIYLFEENAAVVALVNLETNEVLDVLYQPGVRPGLNRRLADRALEIALNAPEVIEALGFRPLKADMPPVPAGMPGSSCDENHYCVAPNFQLGDRALWAVVDLTADELAGVKWGEPVPQPATEPPPSLPGGCPASGQVEQDGWSLSYATTGTDGLRVYDVSYAGAPVLTSVKQVEWHIDYNFFGYLDEPGCGGGGGGFPIPPYGETQVITLTNGVEDAVGFEIIQDFRTNHWGIACEYRYENRFQFFSDGRFRIASAAYGKGCQTESVYRPVVRIDVAVNGDEGDTFYYLEGDSWQPVMTETYRTPYPSVNHGPHQYNSSHVAWMVLDESGRGYLIAGDRGQYAHSRGADPFWYVTQHHSEEGDVDMGLVGNCCHDDYRQGPEKFLNGEAVAGTNLVLWYVPQMVTVVDELEHDYYCWTVSGEPDPETYPCITGPMFIPFQVEYAYRFPFITFD